MLLYELWNDNKLCARGSENFCRQRLRQYLEPIPKFMLIKSNYIWTIGSREQCEQALVKYKKEFGTITGEWEIVSLDIPKEDYSHNWRITAYIVEEEVIV